MDKSHPCAHLIIPDREPDYIQEFGWQWKMWWPEMVAMKKNSSGQYETEAYKLGTCPLTKRLMYMPPIFYIQWVLFDERDFNITNAFRDYIDRMLLDQ